MNSKLEEKIEKLEIKNEELKSQSNEIQSSLMQTIGSMAGVQGDIYIASEGLKIRESAAKKMVQGLNAMDQLLNKVLV